MEKNLYLFRFRDGNRHGKCAVLAIDENTAREHAIKAVAEAGYDNWKINGEVDQIQGVIFTGSELVPVRELTPA